MLGYIQTRNGSFWASKISDELSINQRRYCLTGDQPWQQLSFAAALPHCYQTDHIDACQQPLFIIHILLQFAPEAKVAHNEKDSYAD
jgi:hypothetical protein